MPRSYRHIQQYEKEIIELKETGYSQREIVSGFFLYLWRRLADTRNRRKVRF